MHPRWLVSLGIVVALLTPVAVGQTPSSYSLKELRAIARSAHPTLASADAAFEAASGASRQARSQSS